MSGDNLTSDQETQEQEVSLLGMSDEEAMEFDLSSLTSSEETESEGDQEPSESEATDPEEENEETPQETTDEEESTDESDEETSDEETTEEETEDEDSEKESSDSELNYEEFYQKITAPFNANGKEMQIDNVDDAIKLMQMGAGYNKKMAALKPNLKLLKVLENNNLLDESKLGYLIDLSKKKPDAITKLIKESGIDPMDIDVDKESEYKPETYTVDDRELALDEVISSIKDSPNFNKTLDLVSNKWDGPSKQIVSENPGLIEVINDHMINGVYDVIATAVEKERMLGRLTGLSDLEAYKAVGDAIEKQNGFAHLFNKESAPEPQSAKPAPKKAEDPKLKSKKRAASSTRSTKKPATPDFNPLSMSDEEFEKVGLNKFL